MSFVVFYLLFGVATATTLNNRYRREIRRSTGNHAHNLLVFFLFLVALWPLQIADELAAA